MGAVCLESFQSSLVCVFSACPTRRLSTLEIIQKAFVGPVAGPSQWLYNFVIMSYSRTSDHTTAIGLQLRCNIKPMHVHSTVATSSLVQPRSLQAGCIHTTKLNEP